MNLEVINNAYRTICSQRGIITPFVAIKKDMPYRGLYIETPYPKIIIDENYVNDEYVLAHEIFHHVNPNMNDGEEFEQKLKLFIVTFSEVYKTFS